VGRGGCGWGERRVKGSTHGLIVEGPQELL
jgi:hypothetical protein